MKNRNKARPAKWKVAVAAMVALLGLATSAEAEMPTPDPSDWWVVLEPKFMKPPVERPIPGAKTTMLSAAYTDGFDLVLWKRSEFEAFGVGWEEYAKRAAGNADTFLRTLEPEFTRDSEKVIVFATLSSDRPLVASTVLAPGFRAMFEKTLGAEFLVVIPNRYLLYAFPKIASRYREYWPMVIDAYDATPYPVSLELFEVTREGLRGIGAYERP
jgi:hypothetical protein